jgi:hypothetical protein
MNTASPYRGRVLLRTAIALMATTAALTHVPTASASPYVQFGIQDDAWLLGGPGTFDERLEQVKELGVDVVRITVRWDRVARTRPRKQVNHLDPAYRWDVPDALLLGLRRWRITPVVTIVGTPRWANGGRAPVYAPRSRNPYANFAVAVAKRYPWVRRWTIWNEPNKYWQLRPTSPRVYTRTLLNPAYAALKRLNRGNLVAAGVTAPRGGWRSVSPVDWIRGMRANRARFDVYAHHPYPLTRRETPTSGGCRSCENITLANLERLLTHVTRAWGARKRIWLTEYGYQTNPPDRKLGVSRSLQARYLSEAALRAYRAPRVDMLIRFLVRDEDGVGRWQSGLYTFNDTPKLSAAAFRLPIAQVSRRGAVVRMWGQVRPGTGRQEFRLRYRRGGGWRWLAGTRRTNARGFWTVRARLARGSFVQPFSEGRFGAALVVR